MTNSLTYSGELTVVTCWCGIRHAVPSELHRFQKREHDEGRKHYVYCPLGHMHAPAGKSNAAELEATLARERARHDQTRAELETTERRRRAAVGEKTKIQNRVKKGVCPFCNRHFENLRRHMECKHADEKETTE